MQEPRGMVRLSAVASLAAALLLGLGVTKARSRAPRLADDEFPPAPTPHSARLRSGPAGALQQFRAGTSNNDVLTWPGAPRWSSALPGSIRGVKLAAGTLYVATESRDGVAAMDAATGRVKWFAATPSWVHGDPVLYRDRVIATYGHVPVGMAPGGIIAFDSATGTEDWRDDAESSAMPAPALSGDTAFMLTGDGCLSSLDAETGAARWHRCFSSPFAMSSPHIRDGDIFAGAADGSMYEWDAATGDAMWRFYDPAVPHVGDAPVAISDSVVFTTGIHGVNGRTSLGDFPAGRIFATSLALLREGRIRNALGLRFVEHFALAVRRSDGRELWRTSLGMGVNLTRNLSGTPLLVDGAMFVASPFTRKLYRLDPATGHVIWSRAIGAVSRGAVTVVDDRLFLAAEDSTLRAFDARSGVPLGSCLLASKATPFEPVVIGGSMLLGDRSRVASMVPLEQLYNAMQAAVRSPCVADTAARQPVLTP